MKNRDNLSSPCNFFVFFEALALGLVAGELSHHDLEEYRTAAKKYHRKIRSSKKEELILPAVDAEDEANAKNGTEIEDLAGKNNATSFLLDLPYPSHFLYSLQLLNLSLPFLEQGPIPFLPEDPPTPQFELSQVLNNSQFVRPQQPGVAASTIVEVSTGKFHWSLPI